MDFGLAQAAARSSAIQAPTGSGTNDSSPYGGSKDDFGIAVLPRPPCAQASGSERPGGAASMLQVPSWSRPFPWASDAHQVADPRTASWNLQAVPGQDYSAASVSLESLTPRGMPSALSTACAWNPSRQNACASSCFPGWNSMTAPSASRSHSTSWNPDAQPAQSLVGESKLAERVLKGTNVFRAQNGLNDLTWSPELARIAVVHAQQMAQREATFSHDGFEQRKACIPFRYNALAENIGMNMGKPAPAEATVQGWIGSPGHKRNLLGTFNCCGVGVVLSASNGVYVSQLLAFRADEGCP